MDMNETLEQRMQWWEEARFALFIHWGPYSVLGGEYKDEKLERKYAEQIQRICKISPEDYERDAGAKFHPERFDAEAWVTLAKNAGMKYVVITAKHHDGYAIYPSKYGNFDLRKTAGWDKDPLKELSEACARHGLKFGVYYSQSQDWHEVFVPGGWDDPDNPSATRGSYWGNPEQCPSAEANHKMFSEYVENKGAPQVAELIEDYDAAMIWFDTEGAYPNEYAQPFYDAIQKADPKVILNQRLGGGFGDYKGGPDSPVVFPYTENRYWEAIQSTLHSWGYNKFDEVSRRPTDYLLRMLATVVSKGGNMMINVGPKGDGTLVENDVKSLEEIAAWSRDHIESIHGADRSPLPVQNWGVVTRKGNDLFLHVFDWPENGTLRLGGLHTPVASAEMLADGAPVETEAVGTGVLEVRLPATPSHPVNSVVRLRCEAEPEGDACRLLDANGNNRMHVTDTPFISGEGLRNPIGVGFRAYMERWTDPDAQVTWKLRAAEAATYRVQFLYDLPHGTPPGDGFVVQVGDQRLEGVIDGKAVGDASLVAEEEELMRMRGGQRMTVNDMGQSVLRTGGATQGMLAHDLGTVTLEPGTYDLTLKASGEIRGNDRHPELFFPRAIVLVPETVSE